MALWPSLIGGYGEARSRHLNAELCLNWYPSPVAGTGNAKQATLLPTPGLEALLSVATSSCRGCWSQDGRTFAVEGATLYELNLTAATATSRGSISNDGQPVSVASNGRGGEQLAIVGGEELKILTLTTNSLSAAITLPLTNAPVQIAYLDGYFLLLEADTVRVWFSALEDGTSWDALDFFARSETSDNLVGLAVLNDRVWCFGSQFTSVYYDSGDADTPFIPYPSSILREGLVGPWAWEIDGDALYWLAVNDSGAPHMVRSSGGQAQTISLDGIDRNLATYPRIDNTEAVAYTQEGHGFVAWTCPSGGTCGVTWVYDTATQAWHQRGTWDTTLGEVTRWRVRGLCETAKGLVVGDADTGDLSYLTLTAPTERGVPIRRMRRAPYLANDAAWLFLDQLEVQAAMGVGTSVAPGTDPVLALRLSKDAGQTFGPYTTASLGPIGAYSTRAVWRRLGRSRADRLVVEVSANDPVPIILGPGASLRASQGSGLL